MADRTLTIEPGVDLAGYRIERLIGEGGMSSVYLAEHVRLARRVALKVPSHQMARDPSFRERFLRESRIAASIDHPHIIPIYDTGEAGGHLFIAMRYVEGEDLRAVLEREPRLPAARAVEVCAQVGAALDAAHRRSLVHRDVKPGNVLVVAGAGPRGEDHCYLCDFGLSKQTTSISGLTVTGQLVGTVDYIAPEQIEGGSVDGRADVYSLACMLYECLVGAPPYRRDTEVAVLWAHMHEPPPPPSAARLDVPEELDAVVARGMAKSPQDRYDTCGELMSAVAEVCGVGTPAVVRAPRARLRRRLARLSVRARVAAGAVVVALAAAAAGLLFAGGGGHAIRLAPDSIGRIDSAGGTLASDTPIGSTPNGLAADPAGVWVSNFGNGGTLSHVDPSGDPSVGAVAAGGTPTGIAVGGGALWVAHGFDNSVTRIDLTTPDRPRKQIAVGEAPDAIVFADGKAWTALRNENAVQSISAGGTLGVKIPVGEAPVALAVSGKYLWVANSLSGPTTHSGSLSRIDLATGTKAPGRIQLEVYPSGLVAADGSIWVTSERNNEVVRLDQTGSPIKTIPVAAGPSAITATRGAIWVASPLAGAISEISPKTNTVIRTDKVGAPPDAILAAHGVVWVTAHPL